MLVKMLQKTEWHSVSENDTTIECYNVSEILQG